MWRCRYGRTVHLGTGDHAPCRTKTPVTSVVRGESLAYLEHLAVVVTHLCEKKWTIDRKLVVYNNRNFSGFFSRVWKNAEVDFPLVGKVRKVASDYVVYLKCSRENT